MAKNVKNYIIENRKLKIYYSIKDDFPNQHTHIHNLSRVELNSMIKMDPKDIKKYCQKLINH